MTRLTGAAIHDWDMVIKPAGLAGVLERHGLQPGEMAGPGPRAKLPVVPGSPITARPGANHLPGNSAGGWTPAPGPAAARHVPDSPIQAAPARPPGCAQHPDHDSGPHDAGAQPNSTGRTRSMKPVPHRRQAGGRR